MLHAWRLRLGAGLMRQLAAKTGRPGRAVAVFALLHVLCCGLPLLLLSGVSLAVLAPYWPVGAAALAAFGAIAFAWLRKPGCATCPPGEGRACATGAPRSEPAR